MYWRIIQTEGAVAENWGNKEIREMHEKRLNAYQKFGIIVSDPEIELKQEYDVTADKAMWMRRVWLGNTPQYVPIEPYEPKIKHVSTTFEVKVWQGTWYYYTTVLCCDGDDPQDIPMSVY
jgi:hypothetical protein